MNKVLTVVRTLFGTAAKKYPWFFVLQLFAMLARVAIPFAAILISPLIIDEICGSRLRSSAASARWGSRIRRCKRSCRSIRSG